MSEITNRDVSNQVFINQLLSQGILVNLDQFPPITGITQFQTKCGRVVFLKHENTSVRTPYWRSYEVILDSNSLWYGKDYREALAVVRHAIEQVLEEKNRES